MKKKAGGQIGCDHLFPEMNFKAVLRMSARIYLTCARCVRARNFYIRRSRFVVHSRAFG